MWPSLEIQSVCVKESSACEWGRGDFFQRTAPNGEPVPRFGTIMLRNAVQRLGAHILGDGLRVDLLDELQQVRAVQHAAKVHTHADAQRKGRRHEGDAEGGPFLVGHAGRQAYGVEVEADDILLVGGLPGIAIVCGYRDDLVGDLSEFLPFLALFQSGEHTRSPTFKRDDDVPGTWHTSPASSLPEMYGNSGMAKLKSL